ncbi:hypothetical protein SUGI_1035880 [Cryptomeria japonica]|nr:hypothetical protein SUGI_1035880 [Cryptomeria japonica]
MANKDGDKNPPNILQNNNVRGPPNQNQHSGTKSTKSFKKVNGPWCRAKLNSLQNQEIMMRLTPSMKKVRSGHFKKSCPLIAARCPTPAYPIPQPPQNDPSPSHEEGASHIPTAQPHASPSPSAPSIAESILKYCHALKDARVASEPTRSSLHGNSDLQNDNRGPRTQNAHQIVLDKLKRVAEARKQLEIAIDTQKGNSDFEAPPFSVEDSGKGNRVGTLVVDCDTVGLVVDAVPPNSVPGTMDEDSNRGSSTGHGHSKVPPSAPIKDLVAPPAVLTSILNKYFDLLLNNEDIKMDLPGSDSQNFCKELVPYDQSRKFVPGIGDQQDGFTEVTVVIKLEDDKFARWIEEGSTAVYIGRPPHDYTWEGGDQDKSPFEQFVHELEERQIRMDVICREEVQIWAQVTHPYKDQIVGGVIKVWNDDTLGWTAWNPPIGDKKDPEKEIIFS